MKQAVSMDKIIVFLCVDELTHCEMINCNLVSFLANLVVKYPPFLPCDILIPFEWATCDEQEEFHRKLIG